MERGEGPQRCTGPAQKVNSGTAQGGRGETERNVHLLTSARPRQTPDAIDTRSSSHTCVLQDSKCAFDSA